MSQAGLYIFTETPGLVLAVVLGLLWGSFATVCIYRWPEDRSVVKPGSHCDVCKHPIRWYDNIPLVSYLWLRGKCRDCGTEFSARHLVIEGAMAMLFAAAWWFTLGPAGFLDPIDLRVLKFVLFAAFIFSMVVITFIDIDHMLILDKVVWPAAVLGYGATFLLPGYRWYDGLIGAVVGYGVPWLIGEIYLRLRDREGLGLGDSTLLMYVGAFLGWKGVVCALFGGALVGTVIELTKLMLVADPEDSDDFVGPPNPNRGELPFGPYLCLAATFYLFAAPWIEVHARL